MSLERGRPRRPETDAARKRAAVEMIARYEGALKRTARRFSLDAEDAEDAFQRALEIVLTKAPTTEPRDLIRWTQTVIRHEAMAVRQSREKLLGFRGSREGAPDPLASIPSSGDGPEEQAERKEALARGREALRALRPAELRALSLLASGHSYREIGAMTGFSQTKVNRVLAEGRNRFRAMLSSSEDGTRCRQLRPLLSAFCDGEAGEADTETVREHLRACARCRATMRAYRDAPRIAAALLPIFPPSHTPLERVHHQLTELAARLPGLGHRSGPTTQIAASGGSGGVGIGGLAKLIAICASGTVAGVAAGVLPAPFVDHGQPSQPVVRQAAARPANTRAAQRESVPVPSKPQPHGKRPEPEHTHEAEVEPAGAPTTEVGYEPPPPTPEPPSSSGGEIAAPSEPSGSAAGEFGP